jgi:hypothetical protein
MIIGGLIPLGIRITFTTLDKKNTVSNTKEIILITKKIK